MARTFPIGGIHPSDNKLSNSFKTEKLPVPKVATIPLSQHIGAPAVPLVAKGDKVKTGQLIAKSNGFVSSNIHSSVTGTVTAIDNLPDTAGIRKPCIVIATELDEFDESMDVTGKITRECLLEPKEIIERIAAAGVVGMGGATFPTHVKLSVPDGKRAEYLVINGVECEPYLTADHRIMLERGEELLIGIRILAKALRVENVILGIENNKTDAIESLMRISAIAAPEIVIMPLKVQYPQGGEKQLIAAATGRQVPSGGLPIDVGCVVQNVSTALATYEAVIKNKPLYERVVTITGKGMERPANFLVRIGTPVSEVIAAAGGLTEETGKVIGGGPMMGRAMSNLDAPVTKGSSGILLMTRKESRRLPEQSCIRCAKCVKVCPMGLEPYMLKQLSVKAVWDEAERNAITDCIECGSCSYTCPSSLPLLDYIRLGKAEVMKIIRSRK